MIHFDWLKMNVKNKSCELKIQYVPYKDEKDLPEIIHLIEKDLSEPYSIFTYRYFLHNWPELCVLAKVNNKIVGVIVSRMDTHHERLRGYIAMLAVEKKYRKNKIGSTLAIKSIELMIQTKCDEIVLEAETTNKAALQLYTQLGFSRDKKLSRYYLNGGDAYRLKLWIS